MEEGKGRFSDINTVFLGYVTLALAAARRVGGPTPRCGRGSGAALVFGVLALGPLLQISGRYRFSLDNMLPEGVTFPLPFTLLHFIPFINANRAPNRNSVDPDADAGGAGGVWRGVAAGARLSTAGSKDAELAQHGRRPLACSTS